MSPQLHFVVMVLTALAGISSLPADFNIIKEELLETQVFQSAGKVALQTSFAHIKIDLRLHDVITSYRRLYEIIARLYEYQLNMPYRPNLFIIQQSHAQMRHSMGQLLQIVTLLTHSPHDPTRTVLNHWLEKSRLLMSGLKR